MFSNEVFIEGVLTMLGAVIAGLMITLSVYLLITTIFSLIIITLPGMYPWRALRSAGDLVVGRRLRLLLRFIWLAVTVALGWIFVMFPLVALAAWIQTSLESTSWIPIVPVALTLVTSFALTYAAGYTYLLYRKVIEDDSPPA